MGVISEVRPFVLGAGGKNITIVRVRTDDGLEGIGEGTINYRVRAIHGAVQDFAMYLVGKDASQIERHWQALYRNSFFRGGPIQMTALSAIEQALWDIRGKALGVPVWDLLGGAARDRIATYTHGGGRNPQVAAERCLALVEEGHRAIKLGIPGAVEPVLDERAVGATVAIVRAVRDAVGPDVKLMVDCHAKPTPPVAMRLAAELAPFGLLFLEEPLPPENVDALATVARASLVPVATGERLFTRWGFREVVEKQAAAVLQPDLGHCGGILEARKIAALAETYYASVAPHNPRGPGVTMASLHVAAGTPNFLIQEIVHDDPLREEMLVEPLRVENGFVPLPAAPGLGLRFDEALAGRFPYDPKDTPHPTLADGAVADW
ncbi:MAG TPA: galactonate dehydratase [Chloroflexota bacterium]|nr:galactonate dehydratase [Chloroflexota bacterium]